MHSTKDVIRSLRPWLSKTAPILLIMLFVLAACDLPANPTLPTPTSRIQFPPTETEVEPSSTGTLESEVKPAATQEPVQVPTSTATIEATDTPTQEPTRVIPGMIGPDNFPEDVNPLTGLVISDPEKLDRRPLAIKISNNARVRPQAGLNDADIVYEHITEGGITRFTAIFYGGDAAKVGSIRSGRLIDLEIPIMYDAAFAYSGSSIELHWMFARSIFFNRVISTGFAHGGFERISDPNNPDQRFEDTLFTNTPILHRILEERQQDNAPNFANGMAFHPEPPEGGIEVREVEISYPATDVYWSYAPGRGGYQRWSDGIPHLDANSGVQLLFQNIVVIKAPHLYTEIIEDSGGSHSIQIQIWGEGQALLYRDGLKYEGVWRREDNRYMLTFFTEEGELLPLAPGKTFFEVVPEDFERIYDTP